MTNIEWVKNADGSQGRTWNPIRGCTRVSPGCGGPGPHGGCYAEVIAARFSGPGLPYHGIAEMRGGKARWTGKLAFVEEKLTEPLKVRKPTTWFVNSMSDLFHEGVPDAWIDRVFAVMALCPQHIFQVLTKRSERMRAYMTDTTSRDRVDVVMNEIAPDHWCAREIEDYGGWPLKNVWLGVSTEDQRRADERVPDLLATPAAVRFVSAEPLLGPIDFTNLGQEANRFGDERQDALRGWVYDEDPQDGSAHGITPGYGRLSWLIVGGESGSGARPMHPDWARQIRDACAAAGVAYLFKQWGAWGELDQSAAADEAAWQGRSDFISLARTGHRIIHWPNPALGEAGMVRIGKKAAGRLLDGVEHNGFPEARS